MAVILGQYFINLTTFAVLDFSELFFKEYRLNPLIPESIVVG